MVLSSISSSSVRINPHIKEAQKALKMNKTLVKSRRKTQIIDIRDVLQVYLSNYLATQASRQPKVEQAP